MAIMGSASRFDAKATDKGVTGIRRHTWLRSKTMGTDRGRMTEPLVSGVVTACSGASTRCWRLGPIQNGCGPHCYMG
jgi:hypothetical protein